MIELGARLEGVWVEEARDSQRLFFISKELQLNTKIHYMEVTATSEDYKIFLYISKIIVSENRSSHLPTPCQGKNHKKGKIKRGRESEKEKGRGRERKRRRKRRRKRKKKRKRKEKTEKAVLKSFSLNQTTPSGYIS